jgi:uncharacterized protein YbaR (Trm112 family)
MDFRWLDLLRCPFCGGSLALVQHEALAGEDGALEAGVLGCECCAFPVVAGIPVLLADDPTRDAMHAMEAGHVEEALFSLLGLDEGRARDFRAFMARGGEATFREAVAILSPDAEGTYFLHRFSDPTYLVAEAVLRALGQDAGVASGRMLDLCGGTGHLTRVLTGLRRDAAGTALTDEGDPPVTVLADLHFWKLWLASRFIVPTCRPVCCDANQPLPFPRGAFPLVVLSDAFPYIWHKRLLADEMMRLAGPQGVVVMPHLHSSLGENHSAGMTLTPAAYRDLLAPLEPRLFSDGRLLAQVLEHGAVDLRQRDDGRSLTDAVSPIDLGGEPSLTLIASLRTELFRAGVPRLPPVSGDVRVNPLYRIERDGEASVLTLTFPTEEYEEEFGACRRYLPERVVVRGDLTGTIAPATIGERFEELRRCRVLLDLPSRYF